MADRTPAETVVMTARYAIRRSVDETMRWARKGMVTPPRRNPFASETAPNALLFGPGQRLANALAERGLDKDEEFLAALRADLISTAAAPVFDLFSALDGEGAWYDEMLLRLCTESGESVAGSLHETLFPIE